MKMCCDSGAQLRAATWPCRAFQARLPHRFLALRKYGPGSSHLYPLVLWYLTSMPGLITAHQLDLESLLEDIESEKIMSPLSVIQVLTWNRVVSAGFVKGWLMRRIKASMEEITSVRSSLPLLCSWRWRQHAAGPTTCLFVPLAF